MMNITTLALSTIFRKLPLDLVEAIVKNTTVLDTINDYTQERYSEDFWYGGYTFNSDYRLVCPPTSFDIDFSVGFPFSYKTLFLERTPFTPGENYAKFGLHKKLRKPLLVK